MELTKKLGSLLEAGIPLIESMTIVADHFKGTRKVQLEAIKAHIHSGVTLVEAFKPYPFPYPFFSMLGIAQSHGKLAETFTKLSDWFERKRAFREQMLQKLMYPIFLFLFVIALFIYFLFFLLPQFQGLLNDFDQELPMTTLILLNVQAFIQNNYIELGLSIVFLFIIILAIAYILHKKKKLFVAVMRIPLVGQFFKIRFTYFFTSQLGLLLESGMGIWEALIEIRNQTHDPQVSVYIIEIEEHVLVGKPLSKIQLSLPILHKEYFLMTSLGEQLGTLGTQLLVCSRLMEERIESQVQFLLKWIEPFMLLFLGLIIALVVLSLFLPILQLIQSI